MKALKSGLRGLLMFAVILILGTSLFWWYSQVLKFWVVGDVPAALFFILFGILFSFLILVFLGADILDTVKEG